MSRGQAAGMSLCHSEDLAGWTWCCWRPGDGNAHLEVRKPGVSSQDTSRHMYRHARTCACTHTDKMHMCIYLHMHTSNHTVTHTTYTHDRRTCLISQKLYHF